MTQVKGTTTKVTAMGTSQLGGLGRPGLHMDTVLLQMFEKFLRLSIQTVGVGAGGRSPSPGAGLQVHPQPRIRSVRMTGTSTQALP